MESTIRLKKRDTYIVWLEDECGKPRMDKNGNKLFLEFDLEDITLPDKYNQCIAQVRKADKEFNDEIVIINKKQDFKKKGALMSNNEEAKVKALNKYYKDIETAMDLFLGKGGTQKMFGNRRYLTMLDDMGEMLKPILPDLQINAESIEKKIKEKYSKKDSAVLKDE